MGAERSADSLRCTLCFPVISLRTGLLIFVLIVGAHLITVLPWLWKALTTEGWLWACINGPSFNAGSLQVNGKAGAVPPPRFVLYRLIGNNMPPLQCASQLLWNTQYTLEHEAPFPDCKKRWVLNQILNATERGLLLDALVDAGYPLEDILLRRLNLDKVALQPRSQWVDLVTAQNEGRNAALADGVRLGARWILPFDGNQFITTEAWEAIARAAAAAEEKGLKYFKVPAHRVLRKQNASWVRADSHFRALAAEGLVLTESQLAFRHDAEERFRPGMTYGLNNKLELMKRACGTGKGAARKCHCARAGNDAEGIRRVSARTARACGYTLRLWPYPCKGVNPQKALVDVMYRMGKRKEAKSQLAVLINNTISHQMLRQNTFLKRSLRNVTSNAPPHAPALD